MPTLQTPTARTIIYLLCIGGLLTLHSFFLMFLWNVVFIGSTAAHPPLNFLEGAGITAFAYVGVIAYRYGKRSPSSILNYGRTRATQPVKTPAASMDYEPVKACAKLSPEQRERLKQELITKCGCTEAETRLPI